MAEPVYLVDLFALEQDWFPEGLNILHIFLDPSLSEPDPEMHIIIKQEKRRQLKILGPTASENFTSQEGWNYRMPNKQVFIWPSWKKIIWWQ
ncbi:hypothetical protein SUGI_0525050 [Cryptomeria japonica]|nr:hypothetical protein SUGI_0525050 [Cryptomeria japonica]